MARITLCGSIRFKGEFLKWNKELTLQGHVVYSVVCFGHPDDVPSESEKQMLERIHMLKIDYSDEIFVLDVDGYIGETTRREIAYAKLKNRKIKYLSEILNKD